MKAHKDRLKSERLRWWRWSNKPPCCKGPCGKELASRSWAWPKGDSKEMGMLVLQPPGEKFCQWEICILWKALYIFVIFQLWTKRHIPYSPELHMMIWVSGHTSTYRESHVSPKKLSTAAHVDRMWHGLSSICRLVPSWGKTRWLQDIGHAIHFIDEGRKTPRRLAGRTQ